MVQRALRILSGVPDPNEPEAALDMLRAPRRIGNPLASQWVPDSTCEKGRRASNDIWSCDRVWSEILAENPRLAAPCQRRRNP